ncbi:hypothetical protein TWF679_003914 [Orbilia oligospora]|uniref:Uncharacterized protein n=1 Tax=Orbilia oligospora TaxID=2813651 RepID=A0A8H8VEE0_ORBOL|nr:hypothetical protein TWF679_003914 [Orbilia oligospora]
MGKEKSEDKGSKPSRLPDPLKLRSGVIFATIPSLLIIGLWAGAVTYVHLHHYNLQVDEGLVPVLGIIASIAIAFKLYVSYQRYQDARLLVGFAFALKHHVRGEYGTEWPDVRARVGFLPTFARRGPPSQVSVSQSLYTSMDPEKGLPAVPNKRFSTALWLSSLFTKEEVAKRQKEQEHHNILVAHQNLPLEILSFLGSYVDLLNSERKLEAGLACTLHTELGVLNEILGKCEGLMSENMPLPYTVIISQIKWLFMLVLPFQLLQAMSWITIPAVVIISFSLLGLSSAASTLSAPFSSTPTPTSLPLDQLCTNLSIEIDTICSSMHSPSYSNYAMSGMMVMAGEKGGVGWMYLKGNKPLAPLVKKDFADCVKNLSISDILEVMRMKVEIPET